MPSFIVNRMVPSVLIDYVYNLAAQVKDKPFPIPVGDRRF